MTLIEHAKAAAYRHRWALTAFGWIWFSMSAAWIALAGVYPDAALGLIWHALMDGALGVLHFKVAQHAKNWKEFNDKFWNSF